MTFHSEADDGWVLKRGRRGRFYLTKKVNGFTLLIGPVAGGGYQAAYLRPAVRADRSRGYEIHPSGNVAGSIPDAKADAERLVRGRRGPESVERKPEAGGQGACAGGRMPEGDQT